MINVPSLIDIKREVGNQPIAGLEKYVKLLLQYTGRNIIVYVSGWLNVSSDLPVGIDDRGMNGFRAMVVGVFFFEGYVFI